MVCRAMAFSMILLVFTAQAWGAGSSKGYGYGGWFERFDPVVAQYNQSGEEFRIEGHCQSACTLFLAIRNVCIDPRANLLFHAGHGRNNQIAAGPTNHMMKAYNFKLRQYLMSVRAMESLKFHAILGRDMIQKFGYRECPKT